MKYVARVRTVLRNINKVGGLVEGEIRAVADMPLPDRVEIIPEPADGSFMLFRYTKDGEDCGDTWHETLQDAFDQAAFEYGLAQSDFLTSE